VDRLRGWLLKLRVLRRREEVESELQQEIRFHIQMAVEKNLREGMSPRQARREAHRKFGGVERYRERSRESWGLRGLEDFVQDVRYAIRMLVKNPLFTVVASLTLALGIGANTALFSVVNGVLLAPLPFEDGHELAVLFTENAEQNQSRYFVSPQDFRDWRERQRTMEGLGAYWPHRVTVARSDGDPMALQGVLTSANYFEVLGARTAVGTLLDPTPEAYVGRAPVAILSHGLWQRAFGGDPTIVGRTVELDGDPLEVVGVLAAGAEWPRDGDIWYPMTFPFTIQNRYARWMSAIARVPGGTTVQAAEADLGRISDELAREFPDSNTGWGVEAVGMQELIVGDTRRSLILLLGATGLILLIASANVSNLLLSRAQVRGQEIAVRAAFGAGRWRIARQLITESMALATVGAVLGLALAWAGIRALLALAPVGVPRLETVQIDGTVLGVAAATTVVTALLFGLAPMVRMVRPDVAGTIKEGSRGSRGPRGNLLQNGFAVAQLALAVMVVVGAGLLVRSFDNLSSSSPGFVPSEEKIAFEVNLSNAAYEEDEQVTQFYDRLLTELEQRSEIRGATLVSSTPLGEIRDYNQNFNFLDRAVQSTEDPRAWFRQVDHRFFDLMGSAVVEGRGFNELDRMDSRGVAVINETLARQYWGEESPLGQRLGNVAFRFGPLGAIHKDSIEIVGVVSDMKFQGIKTAAEPAIFTPAAQSSIRRMTVIAEGVGGVDGVLESVRSVIRGLDPSLPIARVTTIETVVDDALSADRFGMLLLTAFGVLSLLLAAIGIYGVLAYGVEQRRREVGIRVAMGASRRDVLGLVLKDGTRMTVVGLGVGLLGAAAFSGVLRSQLFGVEARDPVIYFSVAAVLATVALLASLLPARRATRIDPIAALKDD